MVLEVENYKKEKFKVTMDISIENAEDIKTMNNAVNVSILRTPEDFKKLKEMMSAKPTIKTPNPHICIGCTRSLAHNVLANGSFNSNFQLKEEKELQFFSPQHNKMLNSAGGFSSFSNQSPMPPQGNDSLGSLFGGDNDELVDYLTELVMGDMFSKGMDLPPLPKLPDEQVNGADTTGTIKDEKKEDISEDISEDEDSSDDENLKDE
jgi:hypothetical protein